MLSDRDPNPADQSKSDWARLRGIAKEAFAALGGAEAFLRNERETFYDPGRDPLDDDWGRQ